MFVAVTKGWGAGKVLEMKVMVAEDCCTFKMVKIFLKITVLKNYDIPKRLNGWVIWFCNYILIRLLKNNMWFI